MMVDIHVTLLTITLTLTPTPNPNSNLVAPALGAHLSPVKVAGFYLCVRVHVVWLCP